MRVLNLQTNSKIAIPILNGYEILNVGEIVRCEADGNYSKIFYLNPANKSGQEEYVVSRILKDMAAILIGFGFLRIHQSHLINPLYIKKILKSEGGKIEMVDGAKIRITQNKEQILNDIFLKFPKV